MRKFLKIQKTPFAPAADAAVAKLLQSCPTLCDPIDDSASGSPIPGLQPTRLLRPWDFPGKSTGVGVLLPSPPLHLKDGLLLC